MLRCFCPPKLLQTLQPSAFSSFKSARTSQPGERRTNYALRYSPCLGDAPSIGKPPRQEGPDSIESRKVEGHRSFPTMIAAAYGSNLASRRCSGDRAGLIHGLKRACRVVGQRAPQDLRQPCRRDDSAATKCLSPFRRSTSVARPLLRKLEFDLKVEA